jgi:hypothetical protein
VSAEQRRREVLRRIRDVSGFRLYDNMAESRSVRTEITYLDNHGLIEIAADSFWCRLIPADHKGPELVAEMTLARLPAAEPGMLFNVYIHRKGRKQRTVVRERALGVWTREDVDRARASAERLAALFGDQSAASAV